MTLARLRTTALLVVLLAALAAGCMGPAPSERVAEGPPSAAAARPAAGERPPAEPPAFPSARVVTSHFTAEPGVAVAPDGRVFVNVWSAPYGAPSPHAAFARLASPFDVWGDTDLAVDENGVLHMVGMAVGANAGPRLPYARSFDGGATWEAPRDVSRGNPIDRPWIVAAPGGLVVATWNEFDERENLVRVSRDGGATWEAPVVLQGPFQNLPGPAAVRGSLVLQPLTLGGEVRIARSDDAGATWSVLTGPRFQGRLHTFPTLAFDAEGRAYLAGALSAASVGDHLATPRPRVHVWRSDDGGRTWGPPAIVSPPASTAVFPWIVAGDAGRAAVAYYENAAGTAPRALAGAWFVGISVTTTGDQAQPAWVAGRVQEAPIRLGAVCTDGAGCAGSDWSLKDYFEMGLTPEGRPLVAWAEDAPLARNPAAPSTSVRVVAAAATGGWKASG